MKIAYPDENGFSFQFFQHSILPCVILNVKELNEKILSMVDLVQPGLQAQFDS